MLIKNKKIRAISFGIILAGILISLTLIFSRKFNKEYAWVDLNHVYNGFGLKKDLENKFKITESARKKILDSLELNLKIMANQLRAIKDKREERTYEFQNKRQEFLLKRKQLEEDNSQLQSEYNQQVLAQINQYVKEYGIEKGYSLIFGAEGSGVIMYGNDNIEITNEILIFINNKYKDLN